MKRLLFIILLLVGTASQSFASFYVDIMGAMVNADDADNQLGFGLGLGYVLNKDIDLYLRSTYTLSSDHANTPNEIDYNHMTAMAGAAYMPRFSFLERFRLSWKNTFLVGYSRTKVEMKATGDDIVGQGFSLGFLTGLQYDITQIISPFFDVGYHKSFYGGEAEDLSVHGFQFDLGVRFYFGHSRKYSTDY